MKPFIVKYKYSANLVDAVQNTWMVKRWVNSPNNYKEAEIIVPTRDPQVAIDAAIKRDSWA